MRETDNRRLHLCHVWPHLCLANWSLFTPLNTFVTRSVVSTAQSIITYFHCACANRWYFHFRSKIGRDHRVPRSRFPVRCENFGDRTFGTGDMLTHIDTTPCVFTIGPLRPCPTPLGRQPKMYQIKNLTLPSSVSQPGWQNTGGKETAFDLSIRQWRSSLSHRPSSLLCCRCSGVSCS